MKKALINQQSLGLCILTAVGPLEGLPQPAQGAVALQGVVVEAPSGNKEANVRTSVVQAPPAEIGRCLMYV